ncbi:16S rRNA (guanine(966)-N(2))-methyltransferase RsmD [soil metagenome]
MRIIAGRWAGRTLVSPSGRVRPTSESLRAALMELIEHDVKGAGMVDLFAGTGALGLEALSRGGKYCDFVENNPSALHSLKANVAALRARERCRIYDRDAIPFVERLQPDRYDIAIADPPYGSRKLNRILDYWLKVPFSELLVLEHAVNHEGVPPGERRDYGDSAVTLLRRDRTVR